MSLLDKINAFLCRPVDSFTRFLDGEPPKYTVPLIPEITRYFLSEAIDDRVKYLSKVSKKEEADLLRQVTSEYEGYVEDAIRSQLKAHAKRWERFAEIDTRLDEIKIPIAFNDRDWATRESIIGFVNTRGVFFPDRLAAYEALDLVGVFLSAIQQVAFEIVRVDYLSAGPGFEVPPNVQIVVRKVLRRMDELNRLLPSDVELKSAAAAETELRVLVARAKGTACLPLRPIPTAPLSSDDLAKHYVGRPDEDALRLARQIRHADGTILVSGYRGVGKSSFVNRVVYHALGAQDDIPSDGWLLVPITINLAKVSGVQNILRLTLRAVREALLETDSRKPRTIPTRDSSRLKSIPLPLSLENEIEPLEEAYIRATYKVTMSRSNGSEKQVNAGSSFSIDPGKLLGGNIVGLELGKFLEGGIKKTRFEKINRELNLLDYDENAAEQDLARLIRSLATPRPLQYDQDCQVRIKLVFVFDELDKMDMDEGLRPMIEGLKNLFLQQYSVFVLVTSKNFYYSLLADRAVEDAMLNSYFSAIVHVPLLSSTQARNMIEDWVDWKATEELKTRTSAEEKLIDRLTRVLVYKSFGTPRDIIRELRLMQEWADTADQPYLTDRLAKSPSLQIFAALQECIEKAAVPQHATPSPEPESGGVVALVSERLVGDEARLEQIRRGLYILTEELINRQTLPLKQSSAPGELLPLGKIHKDNFSLLSFEDVQNLAIRLGGYLELIHDSPDLFQGNEWGSPRPLFEMQGLGALRVTNDFYALTGRQVVAATPEAIVGPAQNESDDVLKTRAESLAGHAGWAAKLAAINIIRQLSSEKLTPELKDFLWQVIRTDQDPEHRLAAAERIPPKVESQEQIREVASLMTKETDDRIVSIYIRLLGSASDDEGRKTATDAIVDLLKLDAALAPNRKLTESTSIDALTVLQTVASYDVTSEILDWLPVAGLKEVVQTTAISVLKKGAERFGVDVADRIISNSKTLQLFAPRVVEWTLESEIPFRPNALNAYFRELIQADPFAYATRLLNVSDDINLTELLAYIWNSILDPHSQKGAVFVLEQILNQERILKWGRTYNSLRHTVGFQERILPYLRRQFAELMENKTFTAEEAKVIEENLAILAAPG